MNVPHLDVYTNIFYETKVCVLNTVKCITFLFKNMGPNNFIISNTNTIYL